MISVIVGICGLKHTPEYMDLFRKVALSDLYNPDGSNERVEMVLAEVRGKT